MKRAGGLWPRVTSFDNLQRAANMAARGKRRVASVARFLERLEPESLRLQRELLEGAWHPGRPFTFTIIEPKERVISAAPFRDRVVHHALIDVLEPWLERRMIHESFACRRGKGTHAALRHARRLLRNHAWFLKLDVRSFFPSLRHGVVLESLRRVIKDRKVLDLCRRVMDGPAGEGHKATGLPIGNLTSQWFANLALDRLDHQVKEGMRIPGYVRYMDDCVLFADRKETLRQAHGTVAGWLRDVLQLELKSSATILAPAREGLPFLGWQIHRGTMRLRPENRRRSRRRLQMRLAQFHAGWIDEDQLASATRALIAHMEQGSTRRLRQEWFARLRPP